MSTPAHQADSVVRLLFRRNERQEHVELTYHPAEDKVVAVGQTIWDQTFDDEWDFSSGTFSGQLWLETIASLYLSPRDFQLPMTLGSNTGPRDFAKLLAQFAGQSAHADFFLDSFSVIENGEISKRCEREIARSPAQSAILHMAMSAAERLAAMSPREFEVLVGATMAELGFTSVKLRRYSKDGGSDIVAVIADGQHAETVLIEVKHTRKCGVAVLDRLNGVRDRESADRAMLVASSHISADARRAYAAHSDYVAAYTIRELFALLHDTSDWTRSPGGLWTKKVACGGGDDA